MRTFFPLSLLLSTSRGWFRMADQAPWLLLLFLLTACHAGGGNQDSEAPDEITYYFSPEGIRELKGRFSLDETTGWYTHQQWQDQPLTHSTLLASVNQNGYYLLSSNYVGEQPLEHAQVIVQIGKQRFATEKIAINDPEHEVRYLDHGIVETNHYTGYRDGALLENIADSGDEEIRIRFQARLAHAEALLSDADRQALIDCFQLSILNRMRQQ
jgi:hypothetical protein